MSVGMRYKKDESESAAVVNTAFLKILKNLDKYNSKVPFQAWIKRIMINTVIDEFRKNRKVIWPRNPKYSRKYKIKNCLK